MEEEEREVMLFVKECFEDMGRRTGQLRTFGLKSEVSPSRKCLWCVSWMDELIGKEKQIECSSEDHLNRVEFNLLRGVKKESSRIKPQNFIRADF